MAQKNEVKKSRAEEVAQIQQHIFEREVDEELRQEKLAALWKKYRFLIFGCVIGVIAATISVEWYQAWKHKTSLAESDQLESALIAAVKGEEEQALSTLTSLGQNGKTGYRFIAQMEKAGILLKQNKNKEAYAILKALSADSKAPKAIREVALVSYVGQQMDRGNTAELIQMIAPMSRDKQSAFYGQAVELAVGLHIISGDKKEAEALLKDALSAENLGPAVKERLERLSERIAK